MQHFFVAILALVSISNEQAFTAKPIIPDAVKKITITDDYSLLYALKIAPSSCSETLSHGPITITDSLIINNLVALANKSVATKKEEVQDICFKVTFHLPDETLKLCMNCGDSAQMYIEGKAYEYNAAVYNCITNIIEASGVSAPNKSILPPGFYARVVVNGMIRSEELTKSHSDIMVRISTTSYSNGHFIKETKELKVNQQGGFRVEFDVANKVEVAYLRNNSVLKHETYVLSSNMLQIDTEL
ncbi:hypothetical protein [Carboxylicivirga taeanensis]|uniref:hypothetical protein n=1 Tax=Carboxylicivirga taeanensis TaxID=1416875 RepID=UPI003F6E0C1F